MNENPTDASTEAETQYRSEYTAVWETTVEALTTAVRLTHPKHGPVDFGDFLASALAAVAANVGSIGRVTAGRSGSWEADLILRLLTGTVGEDEEYLLEHRTEPVVIPLNVARLMQEEVWVTAAEDTAYELEKGDVIDRHSALPDTEYDQVAEDAEYEAVTARWAARYAAYAQAFTAAVTAEAARIGVRVPVTVEVFTDPDNDTEGAEHPDGYDLDTGDQLVIRLWDAARRTVPLPGSDTAEQEGAAQ